MDEMYVYIGGSGLYQMLVFFALLPFGLYSGLDIASQNVLYGVPNHWCKVPYLTNFTIEEQKELAQECVYYDVTIANRSIETGISECQSWFYEDDIFTRTAVTEWNLVCDLSASVTLAQTMVMFSFCFGSFVSGPIADIFGRKTALISFNCILIVFGVASCFSTSFIMFLFLRVVYMCASRAANATGLVLIVELFGPGWRTFMSYVYQIWVAVGVLLLGGVSFFIRDFVHLQYVLIVPGIVCLSYIWFLPESPRFLFVKNKTDEVSKLLRKIISRNKRHLPSNFDERLRAITEVDLKSDMNDGEREKMSLSSLRKYPRVGINLAITSANMMINAMIYAAITFNTASLSGDVYLNLVISGVTEIPAHFIAFLGTQKLGRKITVSAAFVVSGLCLLGTIPLVHASSIPWLVTGLTLVARAADACAGSTSVVLTSEFIPTSVRQLAMGFLLASNGIGGILAPFLNEILQSVWISMSPLIFGVCALLMGLLSLLLPETLNQTLPETLQQANDLGRKSKKVQKNSKIHPVAETNGTSLEKY